MARISNVLFAGVLLAVIYANVSAVKRVRRQDGETTTTTPEETTTTTPEATTTTTPATTTTTTASGTTKKTTTAKTTTSKKTTTKKTTTTKPPECAKAKFSTMPKDCCNVTALPIFNATVINQCNPKKDKTLNLWLGSFVLNTLQQPPKSKTGNQSVAVDKNSLKTLCSVGNFFNCLLDATGALKDGAIDFDVMKTILTASQNNTLISDKLDEVVDGILGLIDSGVNENLTQVTCPGAKKTDPATNISTTPIIFQQMLMVVLIADCPGPLNSTKKNNCDPMRAQFQYCASLMLQALFPEMQMSGSKMSQTSFVEAIKSASITNSKKTLRTRG